MPCSYPYFFLLIFTLSVLSRCLLNCSPCPLNVNNISGIISEVAPSIPPSLGGDFIELHMDNNAGLCGASLWEGEQLIKIFPAVTPNNGPFGNLVLLHAGQKNDPPYIDETDLTGDLNANGVIDLYSSESSPGLYGTVSDNLSLYTDNGHMLDFLSWTNPESASYSETLQERYDIAASSSLWTPSCQNGEVPCYHAQSVSWKNQPKLSMNRTSNLRGALAWTIQTASPGKIMEPRSLNRDNAFTVLHSPFSPYNDHPNQYNEALFLFNAPPESLVTLQIFDINGNLARKLLSQEPVYTANTILSWDGRDDYNQILPIGLYFAQFIAETGNGQHIQKTEVVVLGRKL